MHRLRIILSATILTFVLLFGQSFAATLQGTVKTSTGTALSGVIVKAFGTSTASYASTNTDGNGHYLFDSLPQGQYRLYFDATSAGFDARWYGTTTCGSGDSTISLTTAFIADMTFIVPAPPATGTGIIKGTVTDYTGKKLHDVFVSAWLTTGSLSDYHWTFTDSNGQFSLSVPAGNYRVNYAASDYYYPIGYAPEYYNNVSIYQFYDAQIVTVAPNSVFVADAVLAPAGAISGIVKDVNGVPISNVGVSIFDSSGNAVGGAYTDSNGNYKADNMFSGTYKVYFEIEGTAINTWYNQTSKESATMVTVSPGLTTPNINAILIKGKITGQVTDKNNVGIADVAVRIFDLNSNEVFVSINSDGKGSRVYTDSSGNYTVNNLPPAQYKVYFDSSYAYNSTQRATSPQSEWFDDKETFATAGVIQVTAGGQAVANAVLDKIGSIAGTISTTDKGVLAGATAYAYHAVTGESAGTAISDSSGNYTIPLSVPGGQYKVKFSAPAKSGYLPSWYNDKSSFESSTTITVPKGSTASAVNAVLKPAGAIAGTVLDATGAPMANVGVSARDPLSGNVVSSTFADASGNYTIQNLPTAQYAVYFAVFPNLREYFDHKPDLPTANLVSVTAPATTSGINATLRPTGSISGKITVLSPNSTTLIPIPITITVLNASTNSSVRSYATSIAAGTIGGSVTYSIPWLDTGLYKVKFTAGSSERWYDQAMPSAAATVSVTAPLDTPNINIDFNAGGTISGTVLDATNCTPELMEKTSISVCAVDVATHQRFCNWISSGTYSIANRIPAGNYKILFRTDLGALSDNRILAAKWYGGDSFSTVTVVPVQSNSTVSDINIAFTNNELLFGTISGTVTDSNGKPVSVSISAYDANNVLIQSVSADFMGRYQLAGLPPGTYKVRAVGSKANHYYGVKETYDVWYDGKSDYDSASSVTVAANETVTLNFNSSLLAPHSVTASVSGDGGAITPAGANTINPGDTLSVSITPATGYRIADVKVGGISIGAVSTYTFSSLAQDTSIVASFAPIPHPPSSPTASAATSVNQTAFIANWNTVAGTIGYYLDVSTSSTFTSFLPGLNGREISNATSYTVSGLTAGTTYYYRVRAYNSGGTSSYSSTIPVTTTTIIVPVNGACGASHSGIFTIAPSTNLCSQGSASAVTGSGPWNWTCTGTNGGSTASCSAGIQSFTLSFASGGNGTLSSTASQTINYGASATAVTAVPVTSYHFVNWTGTNGFITTTANPLTVGNVTAAMTITANFAADPVNGACGASNGGTFTVAPSASLLCSQGSASAVTGSGPWNWTCTGTNGGSTASCSAGIQSFTLSFASGGNGTLSGTASQTITYGASATAVTAIPATGYHFVNWTGTNGFITTTTNPLTVGNVTAAMTITANFAANAVTGACGASNGGTFTVAPSANLCSQGSSSGVTGSGPWNWTCTGTDGGSTASCSAGIQSFTLSFASGGNGTLSGTASQTITYGASAAAVTAIPAIGYHFVNWTGTSGFATTTTNPLTVGNVTAAMTITANFAANAANGACGASNGSSFQSEPAVNLCSAGTASPITGSGPWSWTCSGLNGGSAAQCSATVADSSKPILSLSTLTDGSATNTGTLNIAGTVTAASGMKSLTINGQTVTVGTGGSFSYPFTLASGANTITTIATDNANNQTTDTRTITLDTTAPTLTITSPADNGVTNQGSVTVSGTVSETATVQTRVRDKNWQTPQMSGNDFSILLTLDPGQNTIEVTATDSAGNSVANSAKRTITYDDAAPTVAITSPAQDLTTDQSSITLTGAASDSLTAVTVTISMDGQTYTPAVTNGTFQQQLTFTTGKQFAITATASDAAGNTATATRNVIYSPATTTLKGDVNNDNKIDIMDALLTLQYALNLIPHNSTNDPVYMTASDVAPLDTSMKPKGDGKVDVMDALVILQRAVNLLSW